MELGSALGDLEQALALISSAVSSAAPEELFRVLSAAETARRERDQISVSSLGVLERRGEFSSRGYRNSATGVVDLTGCERFEARRRLGVAEWVCERVALDGTVLPPRLPATSAVFGSGSCALVVTLRLPRRCPG